MLISIDQKSEENFVVNMMMSAATEKLSGILWCWLWDLRTNPSWGDQLTLPILSQLAMLIHCNYGILNMCLLATLSHCDREKRGRETRKKKKKLTLLMITLKSFFCWEIYLKVRFQKTLNYSIYLDSVALEFLHVTWRWWIFIFIFLIILKFDLNQSNFNWT